MRWSGWQRMISTSLGATVHRIMNCIHQKQQLDALALFIDFAAAHTNPTPSSPPADSAETRLYNLTTSTLVLLAIR